ncbi:MAG TPA: BREX-1 system adenine-specific DNA-methyltransferase PglX [Vicinamibacterales bacterium]|jgi:hypothetical protein
MDQEIRNRLRSVVTQCRKLLEDAVSHELEGKYSIFAKKDQVTADPDAKMTHLTEEEQATRKDILEHLAHVGARGFKPREALEQLIREIAFTHLNRLCAYKMMEVREVYVGGHKFREAVSRGVNSNGVKFFLADRPEELRLFETGHQEVAYRHFLNWLGASLSKEIGVLFNPSDPANRLYPQQKTLDDVLALLNSGDIAADETALREQWARIWSQDETIGWVYQYFTPKEMRDEAKKGNKAPSNSNELAFLNQFFTPRYVVEFLADNTLGRLWYEMREGVTALTDRCRYLVRRPSDVFLADGQTRPEPAEKRDQLSPEDPLTQPAYIQHRPKKDPRDFRILDPACGSGHFLLYCFGLLLTIYQEAYSDPHLGSSLKADYPTLHALQRDVPRLILAHNLHGIDIDLRATQIAALALWLRCQRAYRDMGLKQDRPTITKSNIACAEPMPGESDILKDFVTQLQPKVLGHLVESVFDKMKLAGEAGSLLKIDAELRTAIASAKRQWVAEFDQATDSKGRPLLFSRAEMERMTAKVPRPQLFEFSEITDEQFWDEAESNVLVELRRFSAHVSDGGALQRRLFAEDAERGFAFIDLCQKRFDVVLMNPPFGEPSTPSKAYVGDSYPASKDDVDAAFVHRGMTLLSPGGLLGAITNRTQFFKPALRQWREEVLAGTGQIDAAADLGFGVLDGALVEAAAYTLHPRESDAFRASIFFRLLKSDQKAVDLLSMVQVVSTQTTGLSPEIFCIDPSSFRDLPESRIAYWASPAIREAFTSLRTLGSGLGDPQFGVSTKDDFRFLRLLWEIPPSNICTTAEACTPVVGEGVYCWAPFAKGGEYSPYYGDIHLAIDWTQQGGRIGAYVTERYPYLKGNVDWILHPESDYFQSGLTYTRRTTSGFSPRFLPKGCVFSDQGIAILTTPREAAAELLAVLMTRIVAAFIEMMVESGDAVTSGSAARRYETNIASSIPIPALSDEHAERLRELAIEIWALKRREETSDETGRYFVAPTALMTKGLHLTTTTVKELAAVTWDEKEKRDLGTLEATWEIEGLVRDLYGFDALTLALTDREMGVHPFSWPVDPNQRDDDAIAAAYCTDIDKVIDQEVKRSGGSRAITKKSYYVDRRLEILSAVFQRHPSSISRVRRARGLVPDGFARAVVEELISYALGCVLGRWEIGIDRMDSLTSPGPFDAVPVCSPATLTGIDGLPANETPDDYPLRVAWDGIVPDDPDNFEDVIRRVREVLALTCSDRAEAVEREACEILDVHDLRSYFRRPGKGGFWDDHVSRYSKSRRKAPIYWLLQSSKRNYALWLYYHRLDKDLLFKALVNYVEPKIRLETSRLDTLRGQTAAAGEGSKEAKRLAKDAERQEDFVSELRDFEGKLRHAANLHLVPDLNDGVVLNVAAVHELVPWREATDYWEELLAGDYEWSSIGKQLRQKGLVS